ncbi:hypothetical protein [Actinoplanes derwentensis]|uniref:Lipoprotein n=1 Tax=Actinoplanes derwentensis TaxID=113562 RepID=A0A1H2CWP8_9ACTN|nr:hypothetical protein [Actinoplanes derwentensis]GID87848.1 hypothetical protein Ade03nite_67720 [Actinoplanes derwentensis]SDT74794.1 hypothetical protein SAMN04489716_7098 [Actinoplanes derwentensis]
MRNHRVVVAALVAALTVTGVTGCESESGAEPGSGSGDGKKSSADGNSGQALTFDLFLGDKMDFVDYAVRAMTAKCMSGAGFPQLQQAGNKQYNGFSAMLIIDRAKFRGFANEEEARTVGFGQGQDAEPAPVVSSDPSFDKALKECDQKSDAALSKDSRAVLDAYGDLGNQLSGGLAVWIRKSVPAAMETQLDCLGKSGFTVKDRALYLRQPYNVQQFGVPAGKLDGTPYDWAPTKKRGTVEVGPAKPALKYLPSGKESELAVAWFRCDQESGRVEKLLEGAHQVEAEVVATNQDKLAELNPKIEAIAKKAAQLVGKA